MKKLLQINVTANSGSTGRIAEGIGKQAMANGWESFIAYGRKAMPSESQLIQIGSKKDYLVHGVFSRVFDNHGLMSQKATKTFIKQIDDIQPEIIHLHNIHGYYLNYPLLFEYLSACKSKIVWTLHDCWEFTGHCSHFDYIGCNKWLSECNNCPQKKSYPASFIFDRSRKNFQDKKHYFLLPEKISVVTVSNWLGEKAKASFLKKYPIQTIYNGVNIEKFHPVDTEVVVKKYGIEKYKVLLGVASGWNQRKGLDDFCKLAKIIPDDMRIMLVGLTEKQSLGLPEKIIPVQRTESTEELAALYTVAKVVLNLSYEETFGMTTVEGLLCGTPGIVYDRTASPELIENKSIGRIVQAGNIDGVLQEVYSLLQEPEENYLSRCREYAISRFSEKNSYQKYIDLYEELI